MAAPERATTIAEVARQAGVSPATVSRVMNGRFQGEPAIAERVRAAAAELRYSPNHLARSFALGKTKAIAFLVPDLAAVADACERTGTEMLVDAYHQLGVVPLSLAGAGLAEAWVVGGGYKYLQLGEGNCFLRIPPHASGMHPVVSGWWAHDADRFAGSTYDPTSHYRAARVLDFFEEQGLTPAVLREISQRQRAILSAAFDALDLPEQLVTRDRETPAEGFGGFLALASPQAARLRAALAEVGVHADHRGTHLRLGPAPYLSDEQLTTTVALLGEVAQKTP